MADSKNRSSDKLKIVNVNNNLNNNLQHSIRR